MTPTTGERLAVLETKLDSLEDRVERVDGKVDALDGKLDQVLLKLAEKPASGWTMGKAAQQAIGGVIGALLLYLAAALGVQLPSPLPLPAERVPRAQAAADTNPSP